MKQLTHLIFLSLMLSAFALTGCGTKVGTGAVDVEFTNNTGSRAVEHLEENGFLGAFNGMQLMDALLGVTPTIYQMKLVAFYLVENVDSSSNNVGNVARIFISNRCDADLTLCGINPTYSGSYVPDYFDFAQGTTAVNQAFNSYARNTVESQVSAGTYRYIRMDFTGVVRDNSDTTPNIKFGTSTGHEIRGQNTALSLALPSPLVLAEGETFTVNLAYNLTNRYYASGTYNSPPAEVSSGQYWTCKGTGSGIPCLVEVEFSPTVTKN